ncbi:MAG: hypothetical protein QNK05_02625 [Myxococcota bacterium]|nr:hypothetical protein [Myxococcota bacterium]
MSPDFRPFVEALEARLPQHALAEPGAHARWRGGTAPDPYGCADAANILHTLGALPRDPALRAGFVRQLRALQDPETGRFVEGSHHPTHTTAHCLGALQLFDARPLHALASLAELEAADALESFLEGLDWRDDPWLASHQGAGAYAARVLAGEATASFEDRYFAWLARTCDPATGLWRVGCVTPPFRWGETRFPHLAGTFHYLFNHEHARRPHPYPGPLVDTCLEMEASAEWPFSRMLGFAEIDWVYCTTRALQQSGHRAADCRAALLRFAAAQAAFLAELDWERDDARDLHALFGALCSVAELQRVLPAEVEVGRPLYLVLDRRPFV